MIDLTVHTDFEFDIATGANRNTRTWHNGQMQWSAFIRKISTTHRSHETYVEYMAMSRSQQDEIKDVGGFIGGYCTNGRRKSNSIAHRQLVTLDIDRAPSTFWEDYVMMYDNAAALYSTHKHSPASPRYRLVIPLNREVTSDEYEPIARRIAGRLTIDNFDDTTYDVNRLMYWPSTSKDGVFEFHYQDGPCLNADEILSSYVDWRDASSWPVSSRQNARVLKEIKKQGDPLEKIGIVGAFCRTYTIHDVIEKFLSEVYEPCAVEGRYTYKEGSTAAGLIVYDDKFAYSHHGTDPASHKLCNAFDLVRLHKYGLKDEECNTGTPINKKPSYLAMLDFVTKDPDVRAMIGSERLAEALSDFEGVTDEEETPESTDWLKLMDVDKKGNPRNDVSNYVTILEHDPLLKGRIAFDDFAQREILLGRLPGMQKDEEFVTNAAIALLTQYLEKYYGLYAPTKLELALKIHYARHSSHPIREYIKANIWDGQPRIETLLIDYLGAEDTPYTRAVITKMLVAGVARVFRPGVKFDNMLIIYGKQGLGKSTFIKTLAAQPKWYTSNLSIVNIKAMQEIMQGIWLGEWGELTGMKKADVEAVKNFVSTDTDRYRTLYEKRAEHFPRQCIFFGTTNNASFLKDNTGNRRFWPVDTTHGTPTKSVFNDLPGEVNQVWAEAYQLYLQGEELFLKPEIEEIARSIQDEFTEDTGLAGEIEAHLDKLLPSNWDEMPLRQRFSYFADDEDELKAEGTEERQIVCALDIWYEKFQSPSSRIYKGDSNVRNVTKQVHDAMARLKGWKRLKAQRAFKYYGKQIAYERVTASKPVKQSVARLTEAIGQN